jgi:shikimate dehydrogenase
MRHFGLIGLNLKHSFSQNYFSQKFAAEHIIADYANYEISSLEALHSIVKHNNLSGFNVTIPYKEKIIPFLDKMDTSSMEIGAVNCVKIKDGQLVGYNTDSFGFEISFLNFMKGNENFKALVFGTGGSSKAVQYCLLKNKIPFQIVSRMENSNALSYGQINQEILEQHSVLINTTPIGMFPQLDQVLPIPFQFISKQHFAYDLIYNPLESSFLKNCGKMGATIKNGLEMLYLQADASLEIFLS